MFFSRNNQTKFTRIYHEILTYNQNHPDSQIQFLHGSSSIIFAFLDFNIPSPTPNAKLPLALIPTGLLRKKYGLYPLSGELEIGTFTYGSRKHAVNYKHISGMDVSLQGIATAYAFAEQCKRFKNVNDNKERIKRFINSMDESNYVVHLKILEMEFFNLLILDPNQKNELKKNLMQLEENASLLALHSSQETKMNRYFAKYLKRFKEILEQTTGNLNPSLLEKVQNQFPVVFCSTVSAVDFVGGAPDEKIHAGEISLDTIKIIYTAEENVHDLALELQRRHLSHIKIIGILDSTINPSENNHFENTNQLRCF